MAVTSAAVASLQNGNGYYCEKLELTSIVSMVLFLSSTMSAGSCGAGGIARLRLRTDLVQLPAGR